MCVCVCVLFEGMLLRLVEGELKKKAAILWVPPFKTYPFVELLTMSGPIKGMFN